MRYVSEETRTRLSAIATMRHANGWNCGGPYFQGHHHTDEAKARIGAIHRGKPRSQKVKEKIRTKLQLRIGSLTSMFGKHHSEETKAKIRAAHISSGLRPPAGISKGMLGKHHSEATKAKMRSYWQNPEWVAKHIRAQNIKPNKAELCLQTILDKYFLGEWKFVGDGQLIIGGKIPDFVNVNGRKQLIELFGNRWHNIFEVAERTEHFRQYGFETIIIWDDELKDESRLVRRLKRRLRAYAVN